MKDSKNSATTQNSYPPWNIAEVAFFYFIVSFFAAWGVYLMNSSIANDIFGPTEWSKIIANPHNIESQLFFYANYILTAIIMFILLYIRVCKRYNMTFKEGFRIRKPENFKYLYLIPIIGVMLFASYMMKDFKPEDITKIPMYAYVSSPIGFILANIMALTIAPIYEELF